MEIDKSIGGEWLNNRSELENLSYHIYVKHFKKNFTNYSEKKIIKEMTQDDFLIINGLTEFMYPHFDNAKLIIRREKIEKILSRGNK